MYSSINSIYFLTPFLISSTYINSSAVWDLVESPGPNLIELHLIFAWSDRVGSAAGYGSSFNIDRKMTTKELGFSDLKYNVVAAQMNRGRIEKSLAIAISSIASTLSTFCSDICLYMTQELNFISFPDELTTGSSIMPHKKNPDVFELVRAKCNSLKSLPNEFLIMSNNLTSGYHRDLQLYKEKIIQAINEIVNCLEIFNYSIKKIKVRRDILKDKKYEYIFSVENLNELVKSGKSFKHLLRTYMLLGM